MTITELAPSAPKPIRIAIVGAGKITVDQHIPAILGNPLFTLAGVVSPRTRLAKVHTFADLAMMLADPDVDAVAVNTPPQVRFDIARDAILAGKHVMLEKPPAATTAELSELATLAQAAGTTLFTAWHSQAAPGVAPARAWLADRAIVNVDVRWCENVRQWHPGQTWIWQPGGLGVFDPGINALSILTAILPQAARIDRALFDVPVNCQTPIAADLSGRVGQAGAITIRLDFLQTGVQTWAIDIVTDRGTLTLAMGGAELMIDGLARDVGPSREYPALYERFASLVAQGQSDVDAAPLGLVADAFLVAERRLVDAFYE